MTERQPIRIWPGAWRPRYAWEHILWITPPWGRDDSIYLDFPEAIFTNQGLLYLSHVNPNFPSRFSDLPPVAWVKDADELHYHRTLPNEVHVVGRAAVASAQVVDLTLTIHNHSPTALTSIRLQTCLFLRPYQTLTTPTLTNKTLHTQQGWVSLDRAGAVAAHGDVRFGWRDGPAIADLPVIACASTVPGQMVAFSWGADTYSLISNPDHPCIHADPAVPDLAPGESYTLRGEIFFSDDGLDEIEARYTTRGRG